MPAALVLLAAGGSTRLGSPKQLLTHQGTSLLRRAAQTALATRCRPVVVVLGSHAEPLTAELTGLPVQILTHPTWSQGMGGSVRLGVAAALAAHPAPNAVLLTLCDQPLILPDALERLLAAFDSAARPDAIVAAAYLDTVGVPVLFGPAYFDALLTLAPDAGAKRLLQRHAAQVIPVPLPEAAVDIDTREQYDCLAATAP